MNITFSAILNGKKRFPIYTYLLFACVCFFLTSCSTVQDEKKVTLVSKWGQFERAFTSGVVYDNPFQDVELRVVFTSPSGRSRLIYGFWDGNRTWRVRFSPNEVGKWFYSTSSSDTSNKGLHLQSGSFVCTAATGKTRFDKHGPVRVSDDGHYLAHEDGTPFFWLADTAWNGALLSTAEEWDYYIRQRQRQKFTAVQWVTTQWRAAPVGDREGDLAYVGKERISIVPKFFQKLDQKVQKLNDAGLLNVPVLLWANGGRTAPQMSPGVGLPDDQAALLAKYMVARWGANDVVWILPGDGDYRGEKAEKWKRIGRYVFGSEPHAPVVLHPGGMHWIYEEFKDQKWVDIHGYQSGHGDDDKALQWIFSSPLTEDWKKEPTRPFINLEPPYEYHLAYQSKTPITPHTVRRAIYWSSLCAPTAGISYGGHGVWGWDDGTKPPTDHPATGIPLPLPRAIVMPGAEQMAHLATLFTSIDFWKLRPAPQILAVQPGKENPRKHIAAAQSPTGDLAVIYTPEERSIYLAKDQLPKNFAASWFDPQSGKSLNVTAVVKEDAIIFNTPIQGDWVLVLKRGGTP